MLMHAQKALPQKKSGANIFYRYKNLETRAFDLIAKKQILATEYVSGKLRRTQQMDNEKEKRQIYAGLQISKILSFCDLVLEVANIIGLSTMAINAAMCVAKKGEAPENLFSFWIPITAAVSKLNVKAGGYIEFAQNAIMTFLASTNSKIKENLKARRECEKFASCSLKEQAKDMVLFWIPIPYVENIRRLTAIRSEISQMKNVAKIKEEIRMG